MGVKETEESLDLLFTFNGPKQNLTTSSYRITEEVSTPIAACTDPPFCASNEDKPYSTTAGQIYEQINKQEVMETDDTLVPVPYIYSLSSVSLLHLPIAPLQGCSSSSLLPTFFSSVTVLPFPYKTGLGWSIQIGKSSGKWQEQILLFYTPNAYEDSQLNQQGTEQGLGNRQGI